MRSYKEIIQPLKEWFGKNTRFKGYTGGAVATGLVFLGAFFYGTSIPRPLPGEDVSNIRRLRTELYRRELPQGNLRDLLRPGFRDTLVHHIQGIVSKEDSLIKKGALVEEDNYQNAVDGFERHRGNILYFLIGDAVVVITLSELVVRENRRIRRQKDSRFSGSERY